LPIFRSFDFRQRCSKKLVPIEDYAEVSRLVVAPDYRGIDVSRLLLRATIATAIDLGRKHLVLECAPFHRQMYEKYGFELMDKDGSYFSRVQDLDTIGQGMILDLARALEHNEVAASRQMLDTALRNLTGGGIESKGDSVGSRICCLCDRKDCWRDGRYPLWSLEDCPLFVAVAAN